MRVVCAHNYLAVYVWGKATLGADYTGIYVKSIMDYAVENLKKTYDIERKAKLNKLLNMQWLKNTSYSANPEKVKTAVYKQIQKQDENKKIEDKVLELAETIKIYSVQGPNKCSSIKNTCKANLLDTMPEKDENTSNDKDIDMALFPNADKLASQKNEEDMLSIVESIVTAKLEAEFCINKEHKDQSSTSKNNIEDIVQIAICTNPSDLQKTGENTEELKLIKHSDGNNNNSKSITPRMSKLNEKHKSTCKITGTENSKASTEAKDKDVHIKTNLTKTSIKADNNTNLVKDNEKSSSPSSDSKKTIFNSSKSLSTIEKTGKDQFNNKYNAKNIAGTRKQDFAKRNVSKNGTEKETKNVTAKPNLMKTGFVTADTCQSKNSHKDKVAQKQTAKQFVLKSKSQELLKRNVSPLNISDDKNKIEKAIHTPERLDSPSNESERKNEKIVNEKYFQSDQKTNRGDFRKNTASVTQYKNSTFSKSMQNVPRAGQAPMYGRNSSYAYNNPKFDRNRNGSAERRVTKKEHTSTNTFAKSNTETEELDTNNLESCATQKKEIIQPTNVKSTRHEVDAVDDRNDTNPVKVETHLTQSKENMNSNVDYTERGPTMSEQFCEETNDIVKVDIGQQHRRETNNEEINSFKYSSNSASDKCATDSQINAPHQYSLNTQHTNDINQLESSQAIWNQSSDNAMQKGATAMSLQQSIQNLHFNTQQTFIQAGNSTRQMSPWESNSSKFYDQHFSTNDLMQLSQIPNTFNAPPYECNAQMPNDNNIADMSTLETTMNGNREHANVLYRYGSNVQQRPVVASDFPSNHSMSACQANQARWNSSTQDSFHHTVEHPYVVTQPTMMHVYNPAAFGPDDFNNAHTMDYVSHPVIYAPSPYMQTWNSQLQYPMSVLYNSPCSNYTTFPHNQASNFNNSMHDQQHKHNPYVQVNNYVRDTYNDTNTCAAQTRNVADNAPVKSNYYYKKYQDNRTVYDVPQYAAPVSYSRSQQSMNFMPAIGINQYNVSYCPPNQRYKPNVTNYMKNPKGQVQDFVCDDNASEDTPPIISPKEFVTNNVSLSNQTDQFATRVFKPEFKPRSNLGYRSGPPSSLSRYNNGGFHRNFQDFPKEYTYPISIGRGTYKTKKT
ncbi:PREDICTED: uncharacterized protein LOC105450840 isoform X2 [Wasmannia auropunctata]|uniref:uncharacterized protein LOC105450840 isoform X2 n=1 Tax=Wasmannia auropunctata TaxID=64793 RepID=UPI0005EEF607|nr:PREDICTED: uncharacterized protein LOC105450840 isoform X2 [Wasmannia auropunctata]